MEEMIKQTRKELNDLIQAGIDFNSSFGNGLEFDASYALQQVEKEELIHDEFFGYGKDSYASYTFLHATAKRWNDHIFRKREQAKAKQAKQAKKTNQGYIVKMYSIKDDTQSVLVFDMNINHVVTEEMLKGPNYGRYETVEKIKEDLEYTAYFCGYDSHQLRLSKRAILNMV